MNYLNELGVVKNIDRLFTELLRINNERKLDEYKFMKYDSDNREKIEQMLTDQYLDMIQAQQDITELQLEILGG